MLRTNKQNGDHICLCVKFDLNSQQLLFLATGTCRDRVLRQREERLALLVASLTWHLHNVRQASYEGNKLYFCCVLDYDVYGFGNR